ncbi:hypothetical protein EMIHUDRAFT_244705 [Emiliania huxleyi CCMP1516]|uniref:histone deacetylase n=2 Tax=Emiliania huxleyi TaxID=2903 RepID=A0A0D3IZP2_EMIH1|nr:hypothetical protein EMIHUDRAFT_244705 [Emiliania huxleyi CCMP1516]EOD16727.1 hypothetical protein EMIHUDRAFT_244705 [Emiliania huxleyi CCMP1516]|eukprot:XP_005769156.1 hypothetical protein EMIHUDRAFT_244705 [Emiliania huxleyi CCMP1516]
MAIGLVYDGHAQHRPPASARATHIETPERVSVIYRALGKARLLDRLTRVAPREATRAEAEAVHTAEHLDALEALADAEPSLRGAWRGGAGGGWSLGRDMFHDAQTACAARRAAGGVVALTEGVLRGEISSGFALAGFCFLNSVAVAARAALSPRGGLRRVLVVDWDVHHGDGTQAIFEEDPAVLFFSLHRFGRGFFPGAAARSRAPLAGAEDGLPLPLSFAQGPAPRAAWAAAPLQAIELRGRSTARAFDPQLVLVSAGFDAAGGDLADEPGGGGGTSP